MRTRPTAGTNVARRARSLLIAFAAIMAISTATTPALAEPDDESEVAPDGPLPTLTGEPVIRDGFHFQVAFGLGGGPDSAGLFHAMEIGGNFDNGWTFGVLHTFIQNKDIFADHGGPDLFGGWMPELKIPLGYDDLVGKVAVGLGAIHIQDDGIEPILGLGWAYGVDFHIPFVPESGLTLGIQMLHVYVDEEHHLGFSTAIGYTLF